MKPTMRWAIVLLLVLSVLGIGASDLPAQGNVEGMTYTSPHFGYQVHWSAPWTYRGEIVLEENDSLLLSDDVSLVVFSFTFNPSEDAPSLVGWRVAELSMEGYSNIKLLDDASGNAIKGGDTTHAWAGFTVTTPEVDGSTTDVVMYIDAHILPGDVALTMIAFVDAPLFDEGILRSWQELANTALIIPPDLTPPVAPTRAPTSTPTPTLTPTMTPIGGPSLGEPAPAFAAGPWRLAVRAVDRGEAIEYLGLTAIDGRQWVVVYVDITNWSNGDATLDISDLTLVTASGLLAPDPNATQSAAALLDIEPANGSRVSLQPGDSRRVVLVYSLPANEPELVLALGQEQLPLDAAAGRTLDVSDPATVARPPGLENGSMEFPLVDDPTGEVIRLYVLTGFLEREIVGLAGVAWPSSTSCFDRSSTTDALLEFFGSELWTEADSALPEGNLAYVWYDDEQGNRRLLNQQLLAQGLATVDEMPVDARFAGWLRQTEAIARAEGVGLWSTCAEEL